MRLLSGTAKTQLGAIFIIQNYSKFKLKFICRKKLLAILSCIGLSIFGISWTIHTDFTRVPVSENWTKERSRLWMNIYKPCIYYRFRSHETASYVHDWLLSEFARNSEWDKGMQITSAKLSDGIISRNPNITSEKLSKELMYWSAPHLGGEYAQNNLSNFSIIVRSRANVKLDESHNLHYKISVINKNNTIVELWNYWNFH